MAIERDRLADRIGPCGVVFLPVSVGQHHDRRPAGAVFFGEEISADHWLHAEQRKVVARDDQTLNLFRIAVASHRRRRWRRHRHVGEYVLALAHDLQPRPRHLNCVELTLGLGRGHLNDLLGCDTAAAGRSH
jgi:hypothetical protein